MRNAIDNQTIPLPPWDDWADANTETERKPGEQHCCLVSDQKGERKWREKKKGRPSDIRAVAPLSLRKISHGEDGHASADDHDTHHDQSCALLYTYPRLRRLQFAIDSVYSIPHTLSPLAPLF